MNDLKGKIAIVTGCGGGIGGAIAEELAKEGVNVVLLGGKRKENLIKTAERIFKLGAKYLIIEGDLTEKGFLERGVEKAVGEFGGVDFLINNAGVTLNRALENTTENDFDEIMNINVKVPYFLTKAALPYLKKSKSATVVNIASVVGHAGYPMQSAYGASKHALLGFTKALAAEVYKDGVRVHAVSPGGVYTDMVKISRPDLSPEGMIMPKDVADLVMFLLLHRSNAVVDEISVHRVNKQPFLI